MSDEMAVKENVAGEEAKLNGDEVLEPNAVDTGLVTAPPSTESPAPLPEETAVKSEDIPEDTEEEDPEDKRGVKRRASAAFTADAADEDFKGFDKPTDHNDSTLEYSRILERMEAEVSAARENFTPVRLVMATPPVSVRASKRARQDTDGSRPSSALSSRSDGDTHTDASVTSSPGGSRARRATVEREMSSPQLRVPMERGWRRELVYRAQLDSHSRRTGDIYYYSPQGKKLRSTREVAEHLGGTGLTLDNFSFFKEPLGLDDPDKEIIRDAKLMRRVESPVPTPPAIVEGKRQPKPKPPKGASPEPTPKSPSTKIKVKSVGSRLNNASSTPTNKQNKRPPTSDNNNSAAWKKPRLGPAPALAPPPAPATPLAPPKTPPPPLLSRPSPLQSPEMQTGQQLLQPCSMSCGRGVPSLACTACLCLYHPHCVQYKQQDNQHDFFCRNCRKSTSPPLEPPPLVHKSGVNSRRPMPAPAPGKLPDKRVLLRMKVSGGGPDGERVWAVSRPAPPQPAAAPRAPAPPRASAPARPAAPPCPAPSQSLAALPQSIAVLNGRRFIVVPRNVVLPTTQPEEKRQGRPRACNGATSPLTSPRRRGRPRLDDTDHFTAFYNTAKQHNYNVALQIFQYLGMRDLARCARVCKLWQELGATPALWRHVRMKNSHVSDWGGLCAVLKKHGTKWLDLRKMLLPQNDTVFWEQFSQHIATVDTLERIELCRCPARAVEGVCVALPALRALSAPAIRDARLDPAPLAALHRLQELRLKSMSGLALTTDLTALSNLTELNHLSLTSIKELGWCACDVIGSLQQLESLELGECTFRAEFGLVLGKLSRLRRLRLERGTTVCAAPDLLRALATLPCLTSLELVNIDVKVGFDDALAECKNIQRLLIIPTYVSQSATTNKQVLSGVLRLKDTLTHLMWGVTIELLRVTELFIDQCEQGGDSRRKDIGECIPVLKPVPGCKLPDQHHVAGPPQVEILPLPTLQRLLSAQLPTTKLKILRIPFHATWRQSLADFN